MPTIDELRAASQGQSEDFGRFQEGDAQRWSSYYDEAASKAAGRPQFRSSRGAPGLYDKPTECPPGQGPGGPDETSPCVPYGASGGGGGGGGGGGAGGAGGGGGGGVPQFDWTRFEAPSYEQAMSDPGYQFALQEGNKALMGSQAAKGVLRTSGSLKDLINYNQDAAAQQYGNVFNRALQGWGANFAGEQAAFQPQFQGWQTQYQGDLSKWTTQQNAALQKYLQNNQQIYGLLNQAPQMYY